MYGTRPLRNIFAESDFFFFFLIHYDSSLQLIYGVCGSSFSRRFGRRATNVKKGNAGPSLALAPMGEKQFFGSPFFCDRNSSGKFDTPIWSFGAYTKLVLAYCL